MFHHVINNTLIDPHEYIINPCEVLQRHQSAGSSFNSVCAGLKQQFAKYISRWYQSTEYDFDVMTHPHTHPILKRLTHMITKLTNRLQMGSEYLFTYDTIGLDKYVWNNLLEIYSLEQSLYLTWIVDTLDAWVPGSIPISLLYEESKQFPFASKILINFTPYYH
eukprot:GHVR01060369.1.p1 GENE.GHVR01060369.1~~GHVR01060369.1.p1  ORF type:complete len:164 (-),score=22.43 GHVR01060369.1:98-589(-)